MPHRPNEANGHIVKTPTMTVWVVGDTSLYDEMRDLPEIAGAPIDLAIVPIGGWGARLSEGHMGPKEAAVACSCVRRQGCACRSTGAPCTCRCSGSCRAAGWTGPETSSPRPWPRPRRIVEPISLMPGETSSVPATPAALVARRQDHRQVE